MEADRPAIIGRPRARLRVGKPSLSIVCRETYEDDAAYEVRASEAV